MKISQINTNYGLVNFVEVVCIDMKKDETNLMSFHPKHVAFNKYIGEDSRLEKYKGHPEEEDYGFFLASTFALPLEEYNKDWHIVNKNFKPGDKYLDEMKKRKICPIAVDNHFFINWFIDVYPCLNDEWKLKNAEYMSKMDKIIFDNNKRMLNAFENQDIKEIRAAIKLGADINFTDNGICALHIVVDKQDKSLFKYLVNKKVVVPQGFDVSAENTLFEDFSQYSQKLKKKLKM